MRNPSSRASAAEKGLQVSTSSLVMAGPISLTNRGMPPHASGIPRSTSGIENTADSPATRRSHADASTTAPPTQ